MKSPFRISPLTESSILYIYSEKDVIQIDPSYQRMSDIWPLEKRQLLIDSILNGFDIPKIYFHEFTHPYIVEERSYRYAIIDGKQRLQSIWSFINDEFPLHSDYKYLHDKNVKYGGMTYSALAKNYPQLKMRFDSKTLPIMAIQTDDLELIEEMFSRLNEAVPLNAAEQRNAFGGPLPTVIRKLVKHDFFTRKLPFSNTRYRHFDVAAKFLRFEHRGGVADTKKKYLDELVKDFRHLENGHHKADALSDRCKENMNVMATIFSDKDQQLRSVSMVTLLYLLVRKAREKGWQDSITREVFYDFEIKRQKNRENAESDTGKYDFNLLEFDRYAQSPNDEVAMSFRLKILEQFVRKRTRSRKRPKSV